MYDSRPPSDTDRKDEAPQTLSEIADRLEKTGQTGGTMTLGEVVDTLGSRAHFTVILVVAAIAATPLSGIPGLSAVCGLMIGVVAAERLLGNDKVYVPSRLRKRGLDADEVRRYVRKARPVLNWVDRHTKRRWTALFHRPLAALPLLVCILSGFAMPFLEVIPFSASIVAAGVFLISLAFVTRDGLLAILSIVPYALIGYLVSRLLL